MFHASWSLLQLQWCEYCVSESCEHCVFAALSLTGSEDQYPLPYTTGDHSAWAKWGCIRSRLTLYCCSGLYCWTRQCAVTYSLYHWTPYNSHMGMVAGVGCCTVQALPQCTYMYMQYSMHSIPGQYTMGIFHHRLSDGSTHWTAACSVSCTYSKTWFKRPSHGARKHVSQVVFRSRSHTFAAYRNVYTHCVHDNVLPCTHIDRCEA